MTKKILFIWDRMGDYHRARIKQCTQLLGKENVFSADLGTGDGLYKWENTENNKQHIILSPTPVDQIEIKTTIQNWKQQIKEKGITHICIPGYGRKVYREMLKESKKMDLKVLMFAESWYPGKLLFDMAKSWWLKPLVDTYFVSGKRAAQHFNKRLGIPTSKIIEGYSVVDNEHFATGINVQKDIPQLLCVARFAPEKNLKMLIEAFKGSALNGKWQLKIVGGGPQKEELQQSIKDSDTIILQDWLTYAELPDLYASANCFILPSSFEPWGLVVNEAMAAGLPIILSDAIGALPDLLQEGSNGWRFQLKKESLIQTLNQLSATPTEELKHMGEASKNIIKDYSCNTWAEKVSRWLGQ